MTKHTPEFLAGYEQCKADSCQTIDNIVMVMEIKTAGLRLGNSAIFALKCFKEIIQSMKPGDK